MKKIMLMEEDGPLVQEDEGRVVVTAGDVTADITEQFREFLKEIEQ